jgi:hypothetical protein
MAGGGGEIETAGGGGGAVGLGLGLDVAKRERVWTSFFVHFRISASPCLLYTGRCLKFHLCFLGSFLSISSVGLLTRQISTVVRWSGRACSASR